jgi:quercetin dioxygenase-like cupin family protein
MIKYKIKPSFTDKRGVITDLIENENINSITSITIKKGCVRGNHYHKKTWQWNYVVSGKMKLITKKNKKKKSCVLRAGELVLVSPNEEHALIGIQNCACLVFTKGPRGGKEYESDTYRVKKSLA